MKNYKDYDKIDFDRDYRKIQETQKYSFKYRILKSVLLIFAWISYGLTNEIIGPTYEDLRIVLNLTYKEISLGLVFRATGFLLFTFLSGLVLDKLSKYAELIMAIAGILRCLPNLLIPISKYYWLTMSYFFIQGISSGVYDVAGNKIMLELWRGLSTAPISSMHAGYGVGAIIAVQLAKPFIKFDLLDKFKIKNTQVFNNQIINSSLLLDFNETEELLLDKQSDDVFSLTTDQYDMNFTSNLSSLFKDNTQNDEISIQIPYFITVAVGFLIAILFLIAQVVEIKNTKVFKRNYGVSLSLLKNNVQEINQNIQSQKSSFLKRLFFGKKFYTKPTLVYMICQIIICCCLFFLIQGYQTIISSFMLTYLTKGPAKFDITNYSIIQTLFWSLFVFSRFISAFIAFKINPIKYVAVLLTFTFVINTLFIIPLFATSQLFYWFSITLLGLFVGPCMPSAFMLSKRILNDYNSFILSILISSTGFGTIFFQQTIGHLLDSLVARDKFLGFKNFESPYIISHMLFLSSLLGLLTFIFSSLIYRKFSYLIK